MKQLKKHESPVMKIGIVLLAIVVVFLAKGTWGVYQKSKQTEAKRVEASAEMEALLERKAFLEAQNMHLETAQGMDEEIRRQFGFAEPGENVFIILDPPEPVAPVDEETGFWKSVTGWFGGD